jgi:polyisoprenoid-binding protein YceI
VASVTLEQQEGEQMAPRLGWIPWALAALAVVALVDVAPAHAQNYAVTGQLRVDGGSTVRSWSCEAKTVTTRITPRPGEGSFLQRLGQAVQSLELDVPVNQLDCDNDTMNDHMWNALEARNHPMIRYRMRSYTVAPGTNGSQIQLEGTLEMLGTTHPITLVGQGREENGALRLQGVHELNMTRWGIRPPRLMLGTLRVHEDVQIHYDLLVTPR